MQFKTLHERQLLRLRREIRGLDWLLALCKLLKSMPLIAGHI